MTDTANTISKLCTGIVFEVDAKSTDDLAQLEEKIASVFSDFKTVEPAMGGLLDVRVISVTGGGERESGECCIQRLYIFFPRAFEIPCKIEADDEDPQRVTETWKELSKVEIQPEARIAGMGALTGLWDHFHKRMNWTEMRDMPLNVIGIIENDNASDVPENGASGSASSSSGSSADGDAQPNSSNHTNSELALSETLS